jgi:hypothetical protein
MTVFAQKLAGVKLNIQLFIFTKIINHFLKGCPALGANLLILCIFSFYHFTAEPQHIIALELWSQLFRRKFVKSVKNIDHDDIGLIFKKN